MRYKRFYKRIALLISIALGMNSAFTVQTVYAEENQTEVRQELSTVETEGEAKETPDTIPEATPTAIPAGEPDDGGQENSSSSPEGTESTSPESTTSASPEGTEMASPKMTASSESTASASLEVTPSIIPTATPGETPSASPAETEDIDYIYGRPLTEEEIQRQKDAVPDYLPQLPKEETVEDYNGDVMFYAEIPGQYDSREYGYVSTGVRNQSPYGACWSYAAIASLESSLLVQGIAEKNSIDLSEWHMAYFSTHTGSDKLGNTAEDYVKKKSGTSYMDLGGNAQMATVALSNWKGAAAEADYYGSSNRETLDAAGEALTPDDAWKGDTYYLRDCYMVPATDRGAVKQLIMANGAVYGSYYHQDSYYNYQTAAYYCTENNENHAITVVGWDDSYSRNNFVIKPDKDGAWLCKNSWGPYFGMDGYFYISYYDTSFNNGNVAAFSGRAIEEGENNYYYSGGVEIGAYSYAKGIAQCYEAKANPDGAEAITGVGFYTYSSGVGYQVQVYRNPETKDGIVTNPTSGEPVWEEPECGETTFAGYHMIDFADEVLLEEGNLFSVVITFDKTTSVLMDVTHSMSNGYDYVYESVNISAPGESFIKPEGWPYFTDLYDDRENSYTPRMNVITENVDLEAKINLYQQSADGSNSLLGQYASVEDAVKNIAGTGDEDGVYLIEIMKDVQIRNNLELPQNAEKIIISGPLATEEQVQLIARAGKSEEIKTYTDLELRNISVQGNLCQMEKEQSITVYGKTRITGDVTAEDFRLEKGGQCEIEGILRVNGRTELNGGQESEETVKLEAGNIYLHNTDMFHAEIKGYEEFQIDGVLVSGTDDNRLVTYQKTDTKRNVSGVYLTINKAIVLNESKAPVEVCVLTEEGAPWLKDSPTATGILVNAGTADAVCFKPSAQNCAEAQPRLLKKGTGVYVYYPEEAPVEVILTDGEKEELLGSFTDLDQAVKYVDGRKDKTEAYILKIYADLDSEKGIKLKLPSYAQKITLCSGKEDATVRIKINGSVELKTDTIIDGIEFQSVVASGSMNISGKKQSLTLHNIKITEGSRINSVNLSELSLLDGTALTINAKSEIRTVRLGEGARLDIQHQNTVITDILKFVPYANEEAASGISIGADAGLTIKNEVTASEAGELLVEKKGAETVDSLSDIQNANKVLTAEKAPASVFAFGDSGIVGLKHAKGIYKAAENDTTNGILQIKLESGSYAEKYSYFIDWYQAVQEVNNLNQSGEDYVISVLSDLTVPRRLDDKGKEVKNAGILKMPAANKCSSFSVKGNDHGVWYTGIETINSKTILQDMILNPAGKLPDLGLKSDKKGNAMLVLQNIRQGENVPFAFKNISGGDKKTSLYLTGDTELAVSGNIKGLGTLFAGADESQVHSGNGSLYVSGTLSAGVLGVSSAGTGSFDQSCIVVTGQLTAEKLSGDNGMLIVRQTSAKNRNTLAKVSGGSDRNAVKPLTVLVLQPEISNIAVYRQRLEEKKKPFAEQMEGIPLIQADNLSPDLITTAEVQETESGYVAEAVQDAVCYKDAEGYIYIGEKQNFSICIKAVREDGTTFESYAANWYEAIRDLDKMGNSYPEYEVQLLENRVYYTGWDNKKAQEKLDTLQLPSRVKGKVTISNAENITAELVYRDEMKVPDKMTLALESMSFTQKNSKGEEADKGVRIGNAGTLILKNEDQSTVTFAQIAGSKGSLVLQNTAVTVKGKADIQKLYIDNAENVISAKAELNIQNIIGLDDKGKVRLETISKYKVKKSQSQMIQLSQAAVTGGIARNAEVSLNITKDGEADYTADELVLLAGEKASILKRLMKISGNTADERIRLVNKNGVDFATGSYCLITQGDGIYLAGESPVIKVTSSGGATDDYIGYFGDWQSALAAVSGSVKQDLTVAKDNQKEYQIIFLKEIGQSITGKIPGNVKKLTVTHETNEERMKLSVKGDISYEGKSGELTFRNMDISVTGKVSGYKIKLSDSELTTTSDVAVKRAELENAAVHGRNITIGEEARLSGGILDAARDNAANSGKLRVNRLYAAGDGQETNYLIAKVNAKGISQITVDGMACSEVDREEAFAVLLMQNKKCTVPVELKENLLLVGTKKADSSLFRLSYTDDPAGGMGNADDLAVLYKKNGGICYSASQDMGIILQDETETEETVFRGYTTCQSIEDAMTEINNRKDKKAVYRLTVVRDQAIQNAQKEYKGLTFASAAKKMIIEGTDNKIAELSYLGILQPKCDLELRNIGIKTYKKSGKIYKQEGVALKTGKTSILCTGKVTIQGEADVNTLTLGDDAELIMKDTLKVNQIYYQKNGVLMIEKGKPVALAGNMIALTEDDEITLVVNTRSNINGVQVVKITALFKRPDLQGIKVQNRKNSGTYYIYREGRNVFAGMRL